MKAQTKLGGRAKPWRSAVGRVPLVDKRGGVQNIGVGFDDGVKIPTQIPNQRIPNQSRDWTKTLKTTTECLFSIIFIFSRKKTLLY